MGRGIRRVGSLAALVCALFPAAAAAQKPQLLEPGALLPSLGKPAKCQTDAYPGCRRLRFFYGPLPVLPGTNAQYYLPVTIQKPLYDGYMVRFRPDLVYADGTKPPVDVVMLHHATWLSFPLRGNVGPFMASGEEKTIFALPRGYGMRVKPTDLWTMGYMIHSSVTRPDTVYVQYDVDFVPKAAAERAHIKPAVPLWLDVGWESDHPAYPVFNAMQGYGKVDKKTQLRECAFPRDTCAPYNPYGLKQPGNGVGYEWRATQRLSGTLIGMGGHLHPGGLRDEVSIVRGDRVRRIFDSEAIYYDPKGRVSQDFSMTVTRKDWRVRLRPGERIRLNAVYDTTKASWYEPMGIVVAWLAQNDDSGTDPFATRRVRVRRKGRTRTVERPLPIETEGVVTHGHLPENGNYGGQFVRPLPDRAGPLLNSITVANYKYLGADLSTVGQTGIPQIKRTRPLTFFNADFPLRIWHTITTCKAPCTGATGVGYPLADENAVKIDSLEIGPEPKLAGINPTSGSATFTLRPDEAGMKSGETYTFFCRIHPFMRGAVKVVD